MKWLFQFSIINGINYQKYTLYVTNENDIDFKK